MKFPKWIGKNPLEIVLAVLLIIFILSPIQPPVSIANAVDSTLGILVTSILIVYLFVYSHTLLAILFVVAIFELIRRSSARKQIAPAVVTYTALQPALPALPQEPAVKMDQAGKEMASGPLPPTARANIENDVRDAAMMPPMDIGSHGSGGRVGRPGINEFSYPREMLGATGGGDHRWMTDRGYR